MRIIIDTREKLPLLFPGLEIETRKLDEGDYNIKELEDIIVVERKSLIDLYGTLTHGHTRFKKEIQRSLKKGKYIYIFVEGSEAEFYSMKWAKVKLKTKPETLKKMISTMQDKYAIQIFWCINREIMQMIIILLFDQWLKILKISED